MGDAQSAQREEQSAVQDGPVQDGPSGDRTQDQLFQNNGQLSDINVKSDEAIAEIKDHCEYKITREAITVNDKVTSVPKSEPKEVPNIQIIQEDLTEANKEEPIEILNVDAKQNDLNESFRKFLSNIGLKLTVKRGEAEKAVDEGEKEVEKLANIEETVSETKYEDVGQNSDLIAIQDNDSTTCPTMTDGTPEDVIETAEKTMAQDKVMAAQMKIQETNVSADEHDGNRNKDESPLNREQEEFVSPMKKFFTTGIFAGLAKKKKEEETVNQEILDTSKQEATEEQQINETLTPNVAKLEEFVSEDAQAEVVPAQEAPEEVRAPSPSTDQDSEPEITSSQERAQMSPFKRLFSGSFKRRSKKHKRKKSNERLSDSGEHTENKTMPSREIKELQDKAEETQSTAPSQTLKLGTPTPLPPSTKEPKTPFPQPSTEAETPSALPPPTTEPKTPSPLPPPTTEGETPSSLPPPTTEGETPSSLPPPTTEEETPSPLPPATTEPEEELSAWEVFKKLMTPKKTFKRVSEETEVAAATVEETKPSEEERISDHSTDEGRKRKDSSHSWEAVLCGSGRRRSRKTSDSEDEHKEDSRRVASPNDKGDAVTSTPKQEASPSDSESSTWKSFKKLMTPKRKVKEDEESKDGAQSDSETTQEDSLFSFRRLLPGRKKKQDQLSSDEGEREAVSMEEDSETPAVVPLSEFDQSEIEETAKTDTEIDESKLESEQEHILDIPKTFVQEVQEHQVTPIVALNEDQDELTEFSKYQPLSDIPEEGNITETVATSLIEEVAKDDTIADDMVEITSEAITAPEPIDITMADLTDDLMLSAASHLPESSKTSGNATPVPAEYDVKDTDVLLKEVAEAIFVAPKADTICPEEPVIERAVGSVSHEMLSKSVINEQNVMEMHAPSETVATEMEQLVDQLQDTDIETPAQVISESLSEFKDAVSTEYASAVSKVEFESAKAEVDEVEIARAEWVVKQESVDDSEYMIESLSEVPESIEIEVQDVVKDVLPNEGHEREILAMSNESAETLLDDKMEVIEKLGNKNPEIPDIPISSESELPMAEVKTALDKCNVDKPIQENEAVVDLQTEIEPKPNQLVQPEFEKRIYEKTLKGTVELGKEVTQEQAQEETGVTLVETVVEEDFVRMNKENVEDLQIPALETQNLAVQELPVQEEQSIPMSCVAIKEEETGVTLVETVVEEDFATMNEQNVEDLQIPALERQNLPVQELPVQEEQCIPMSCVAIKEEEKGVTLVETVVEEDFATVSNENVDNLQIPALEMQNLPVQELHVQEEQSIPIVDVAIEKNSMEAIETINPEQDVGKIEEVLAEGHISEVHDKDNKDQVFVTEASAEREDRELPVNVVQEVEISEVMNATIKSLEETVDSNPIQRTVPLSNEEILEQKVEDDHGEVALQVKSGESEKQPFPEVTACEIDGRNEVQEKIYDQEEQLLPEVTNVNDGVITSSAVERRVSFKLDHIMEINGDHTEATPSAAQVMQEDHSYEVIEDIEESPAVYLSSIDEDSGIVQELEVSVDLEKSSELFLSTSEEPIHEMHLGETEANVEEQFEEEIPCRETELAKVECVALPEKNMATSQQAITTMPDLLIQNTVEDSEIISAETSIPCIDNAMVFNEPTHEVQLTDVQEVGVRGEKEEDIVPPDTTNVDVQYAFVAGMTTATLKNVASGIPDVSIGTTTQTYEPVIGTVTSDQEQNQTIETTTPLEVNNATQVAQEGKTVVLLHASSVKLEDDHPVQVQVTDVDIQSAEKRMDTTLEIVVQKDRVVLDTCHETVEKVHSVLATPEIEQEMVSDKDNIVIHEVVQYIKELAPQLELEPEYKEPTNDVVNSKLSEGQKIIETQDEEDTVAHVQDSMVTTQDKVLPKIDDIHKVPPVENTLSNTAVAVPQNTGIVTNTGNVDTPSSLSLEFKLNIQFGHSKAPILPPPPTTTESSPPTQSPTVPTVERREPSKFMGMTDVGVQAVDEESKQVSDQQKSEISKYVEQNSREMETTDNPPEVEELNDKDKIPEGDTPSIHSTDIVLSDKEFLRKKMFTELVVLQVSKDPLKQTEDEDENQDIWMDAEEDIDSHRETTIMPIREIEESFESQPDYFQETKSDFEESFDSLKKTTLKNESEEEDFAAALEDPQITTVIATLE